MQETHMALRKAAFYKRWYIALFCACIGLLLTCPSVKAQDADTIHVSLKVTRTPLRQVLRLIEKQTGLTFAISSTVIENSRNVSIVADHQPLNTVLQQLFSGTRYAFEVRNKQIIVFPILQSAPISGVPKIPVKPEPEVFTVSGVISDGEKPLAGVSIREKGTRNGASTNETGRFKLTVNNGDAVLQISLIGYEPQEIALKQRKNLDVLLTGDTKILNDLVIIGYGIQTRANINGAITKVEGRRLKSRPVTNVMAALQGTAPGLLVTRLNGQPGKEGFNLQIRGLSSGNNSDPLVLVDGAPGSIALLNPNDIESVSVLKDAAAASIYSPQGAGGVVLVTTKRGKAGKINVEYNSLFGLEHPINLPKRMHSWQAAALQNTAATNAGLDPIWSEQEIGYMKDPAIGAVRDLNGDYKYYYDNNPLENVTRQNSSVSNFNISARGGSLDHQYLLSLGTFARQGLFNTGPDNTNRNNAQLNINNRFSDMISLETSLQYARSHTQSPGYRVDGYNGLLNYLYQAPGYLPTYVPNTSDYTAGYNPISLLEDGGKRDEQTSFADATFSLKAENPVKGLTLKAVYSPQITHYYDGLGKQTIRYYNGNGYVNSINDPNSLKRGDLLEVQHSLQLLADYDIPAGKLNTIHILGGYAYESHYQRQKISSLYNVTKNEIANVAFNDPLIADRRWFKASGSQGSMFARLNYNFNDRYLLEANVVAARLFYNSSEMGSITRQHIFPSFSGGWRLNNEKWFGHTFRFFDEFKLRASWGLLGNFNWRAGLNDYNYRDQLKSPQAYPLLNEDYSDRYMPGNNNWETINTTNAGLDMAFLKGRLTVTADYFVKHNPRIQIASQTLPPYNYAYPAFFIASMHSWGWELNIGWRDNRGAFSYWVNANLFDGQNKILSSDGNTAWLPGNNKGLTGLPYNAILGYKSEGYFRTNDEAHAHAYQSTVTAAGDLKYVDQNNDGIINGGTYTKADHGDLVYLGSSQPRYSYGFDAGFSYKGVDFSVFFQGIGERKVMVPAKYSMPFVEGWQQPWQIHADYWTPGNQYAAFPRLYNGYNQNLAPSSFWVMNAAYVRLKNLQLGYTFRFTHGQPLLSSLRVYFSGQDLWEINHMKIRYYDPEQAANTGYQYPFFRSFTLGMNAIF
ncbi:SusC/RagA family TonB-linked outer membrane protein [Chitinophaga silvisoli]|uniref:SusC/RagA family TonB-linked outer membrane protein n=2 Tax=Chitinophaga silvisoli TaxID=2291814 RepID=A0A3E1P101_9BACT|nr:SusC/RagA family TonB-linked outer membrane protein [Chitinophaga silvisoli]